MDWLGDNSAAIQAIGTAVLVVVTLLYVVFTYTLARKASEQVEATATAARTASMLAIVDFVQAPHYADARATVRGLHPTDHWKDEWSEADQRAASLVCTSYSVAARLVNEALVNPEPLLSAWGPNLIRCFNICKPFIEDTRAERGATLWRGFESLVDQVPDDIKRTVGH